MPAEDVQLESVGGDTDRCDDELRPELMRRAIADMQDAGVEVDVWKIEGVERREECEMLVEQARSGGRDGVTCVLLGRGADDEKVDHWLTQVAPVEGFIGFAIGRSIWSGPLKGYLDGSVERDDSGHDRRQLPALHQGLRVERIGRGGGRSAPRIPAAGWITCRPMRMRQTLADFEAAFHEETAEEQARRARLRRAGGRAVAHAAGGEGSQAAETCASQGSSLRSGHDHHRHRGDVSGPRPP